MEASNILGAVVLVTALCGLVIVSGGIFLLAKGAITLAGTSATDALSVEWQKKFKLSTQVPGIAFFVIGLFFILAALNSARLFKVEPIDVNGEVDGVDGVDGPVMVVVRPEVWQFPVLSGGVISARVYPDVSKLFVEASAPGYVSRSTPIEITSTTHVRVVKLQLTKKLSEIPANSSNIKPITFPVSAVTDTTKAFGAPR